MSLSAGKSQSGSSSKLASFLLKRDEFLSKSAAQNKFSSIKYFQPYRRLSNIRKFEIKEESDDDDDDSLTSSSFEEDSSQEEEYTTHSQKRDALIDEINKLKTFELEHLFHEVAVLTDGNSFGELALISNKPRSATIICKKNCHFAVMQKQEYDKLIQRLEFRALEKKLDFLSSLKFVAPMNRSVLQARVHQIF